MTHAQYIVMTNAAPPTDMSNDEPTMDTFRLTCDNVLVREFNSEDTSLAIEDAIMFLNSHLAPTAYRQDDAEPDIDCISNDVTILAYSPTVEFELRRM